MNGTKVNFNVYKAIFLFYLTILIGKSLHIDAMVSLGTIGIFLCSICAFFFGILNKSIKKSDFLITILILYSIFLVILTRFDYETLTSFLMFIEIPLLMVSVPKKIDEGTIRFFCIGFFVLFLFYFCVFFTDNAHYFNTKYGVRYVSALTLGYNNPNETSIYLFTVCVGLVYSCVLSKKAVHRFLLIAAVAFTVYLIYLTESRIMIVLSILFCIVIVPLRNKKPGMGLARGMATIPFVFVLVLVYFSDELSTVMFMGDTFDTGRSIIYSDAFKDMSLNSFLFGDVSKNFQNMHNAPLSIFLTVGIMGMIMYYAIVFSKIFRTLKEANNCSKGYLGFWALFLLLIHSSVESGVLISGSALSMCLLIVFLFSQYEVCDEDTTD